MATIWESLEASGGNAGRARFGLFFLVVEPGPPSLLFRFFGAMLRLGAKGRGPGCCGAAAAVGDLPIKIHLSILEFGEKNRVWGGPVRTRRRCEKLRAGKGGWRYWRCWRCEKLFAAAPTQGLRGQGSLEGSRKVSQG